MSARLRPYPAYKDSGLEWLGRVPEHWRVVPNRALFREITERDHPDAQMLSVTIKRGVIRHSELLGSGSKKDSSREDRSAYKLVQPGDIVYNKMRAWQGAVGVSDFEGIVSPAYIVQRLWVTGLPRYFHYLFRTPSFAGEAQRWSYGLASDMWSLRPEHFRLILSCAPPLEEQSAIVRYLGYVDRRVRRYIGSKERQVRLLEEHKQALIQRAVTQGLDADVDLKTSGVEWPGQVPSHWTVPRMKAVCGLGTGHTPSRKVPEYWQDCTIPWFTLADVHQVRGDRVKRVFSTEECVSALGIANSSARLLPEGTVILSRTASVGLSGILGRPMATSQDFMAWIPGPEVVGEFLLYVLRAMRPEFRRLMHGSTHNTIYMPTLHSFRMPLPPLAEQEAIVCALDQATAVLDNAVERASHEMALMKDYRTRLTADVVTGRLNVQDASDRLPDAPDELAAVEGGDMIDSEDGVDDPDEATLEEVEA